MTCPFDHHSAEYAADPAGAMRRLRDGEQLCHSELYGGFYVAARYADVAQVTRDHEAFSSDRREGDPLYRGVLIPQTPMRMGFIEMDAPESLPYRRAALPFLTPAAVEAFRPQMELLADEAIDDFIERGTCDVVREFTDRVPATVMLRLLGLPVEKWRRYVEYFHHLTGGSYDDPDRNAALGRDNWVLADLAAAVAQRRENPKDDTITRFIDTPVDGVPMADDMAAEMLLLLMSGGLDTTSALLANTVHWLGGHLDERRRLIGDPACVAVACEEFLRVFSPVQALARNVVTDTVVDRTVLPAGSRVLVSWASANLDEREFPDADQVVLDRFPNRHQAFGLGQHRCVGSNLARVEFDVAMQALLRRVGDYRVVEGRAQRYPTVGTNNGWTSIEIEFTPGKRLHGGGG